MKKVTKLGFTAGAVFTSSMVGQMVIPVPILGAVIGGIVGGLFSKLFGQVVDSANSNETIKYTLMIKMMMEKRDQDGSWDFERLGALKPVLARWFTLCKTRRVPDKVWLSSICFLNISLYCSIINMQENKTEEQENKIEEINRFMEPSIEYFASRINFLEHEAGLMRILETLTLLCNEGYIKIDFKMKKKKT